MFNINHKAVQVACGDSFTLVLSEKNQVYSFGKSTHGRLGTGATQLPSTYEPTLIENLREEKIT
jgi:alpha-tubulin suppressor-like RCC1 family protein